MVMIVVMMKIVIMIVMTTDCDDDDDIFQGNTPRIQALKSQDKELAKYLESK